MSGVRDSGLGLRDSGIGLRDSGIGLRERGFSLHGSGSGHGLQDIGYDWQEDIYGREVIMFTNIYYIFPIKLIMKHWCM